MKQKSLPLLMIGSRLQSLWENQIPQFASL